MNLVCKPKLRGILLSDRFTSVHGVIQWMTMFTWLTMLTFTDAYYIIYLLLGIAGFVCRVSMNTDKRKIFARSERANVIMAAVFSFLVLIANYHMFKRMVTEIIEQVHDDPEKVYNLNSHASLISALFAVCLSPLLFLGGLYCAYFILTFLTHKIDSFSYTTFARRYSERRVFLFVFTLTSAFHLLILALIFYPGIITYDSINQITQCMENSYSNAHPVFHTMIVRLFLSIGIRFFHDINLGCALYSIFSVLLTSAAFAYAVATLYKIRADKRIILAAALYYLLFPNHILYSFTMWKDVPFSTCVLLFTVAVFRHFKRICKRKVLNNVLIVISSLGICLLRGNGLIVYFIILLSIIVLFRKKFKRLAISFACILAASLIAFFPVMRMLDIEQSDTVELSSMAIQQIAKTLYDGNELTDEQRELISRLADIEKIKERYSPIISDPLKNLIRNTGNKDYLAQNKLRYALMYFQIGLAHPLPYFEAWVDQTRGYWNAGYNYKVFRYNLYDNPYGIERNVSPNLMTSLFFRYLDFWQFFELAKPFHSIGLFTWLTVLVAYLGYRKKDKLTVFLTIPCLSIIFTLMIGTPVFADNCYAYALFCCLPFLIALPLKRPEEVSES